MAEFLSITQKFELAGVFPASGVPTCQPGRVGFGGDPPGTPQGRGHVLPPLRPLQADGHPFHKHRSRPSAARAGDIPQLTPWLCMALRAHQRSLVNGHKPAQDIALIPQNPRERFGSSLDPILKAAARLSTPLAVATVHSANHQQLTAPNSGMSTI